jgi:histone-lysine N-methyltransferase SETMAR
MERKYTWGADKFLARPGTKWLRALATQKKLGYLGFQYLGHPPYSPDLAPSDYHLFPGLKTQLKGK